MERKLETFATFSQARAKVLEDRIEKETSEKRENEAKRFTELLASYNVTSVSELAEEKRMEFFTTLLGETSTENTEEVTESVEETEVVEAEVSSDEDFMEMAMAVYKEAFGDEFDEDKAKEAAKGMLKKADGDYGAAVGMLQSSLG
tara:strand:- start:5104 stop:5541 length:438 start_codon:yes stop_codon:yes gene_type:complete